MSYGILLNLFRKLKKKVSLLTLLPVAICTGATSSYAAETYGPPAPSASDSGDPTLPDSNSAYRLSVDPYAKTRREADELELAYQLLNALDAAQTLSCMHKTDCHEANPILGKHPSNGTIIGFKAGSAILHYGIGRYWIKKNPHEAILFEVATVAVQGVICGLNFRYAF